jgi:voltage-dependent potassium channel beta subunit
MIYHRLGRSGLRVSAFSLGSWRTFGQYVDDATTERILATAYDCGINLFDGAESYGLGRAEEAMARAIANLGWARDSYIITSKASIREYGEITRCPTRTGVSRKRMRDACDNALRRLRVDYLDIFFCHRPEPGMDLMELLLAMNDLIHQGKCLYWGTSEFSSDDLIELHRLAGRHGLNPPVCEQTGHNMVGRNRVERDLLPALAETGIGITSYVPLKSGLLAGRYNDGVPADSRVAAGKADADEMLSPENLRIARALAAFAAEFGAPMAHVALAWVLKTPGVSTCILGASRPEQVQDNVRALDLLDRLTPGVMTAIDGFLANRPEPAACAS